MIRPVESDADLAAYVRVWNAITPGDPTTVERQRERLARDARRLYLLAEVDGAAAGCGFAGPSDSPGRAAVAPRVLPEWRRRGLGSELLPRLCDHLAGFASASAHVDGGDGGSLAFAARFGFEEVDRQVEQIRTLGDEPAPSVAHGVRLVSVADRPELLERAYPLAVEGFADMATWVPVTISRDEWLEEEATLPAGSFVALAGEEVVGFSGLCRHGGDPAVAWDGLTVVRRDWRRRGLALALKRAELAWAAANGVRRVVTWTQRGNEAMRALNELLGYVDGSVTITVARPLPLGRRLSSQPGER